MTEHIPPKQLSPHERSDQFMTGLGQLAQMKTMITDRPVTIDDVEAYRIGFEAGYEYGRES